MALRIAIAHNYLTQRGGAERVALAMLRSFPDATLYTTLYNSETTYAEFAAYDIRTTQLNNFQSFRNDPRRALPFLARATSKLEITDVDVVLASTSGWAHGVTTTGAPIVAYCHTPARWLYEGTDDFRGAPAPLRAAFSLSSVALRRWDRAAARRVATYIANSSVVARRIERVYGVTPEVIHPPTTLTDQGPIEPVPGVEPRFLLTVGRNRGYKNIDRICDAVASRAECRLVVAGDLPKNSNTNWPGRIRSVRGVTNAQMRWLYANCVGVVAMSYEDFGLTPVEGFNFGTPALALAAGGYLDSCSDPAAGVLAPSLEVPDIAAGIDKLKSKRWDPAQIRAHGQNFSIETFAAQVKQVLLRTASRHRSEMAVHAAHSLPAPVGVDVPVPPNAHEGSHVV